MTELGDSRRLFLDRGFVEQRFMGFFMDLRPPGRFGSFPHFGFYYRAPHHMFGDLPFWRADLRLCQGFHGPFHGNLHGRLNFGFSHRGDIITGCPGYFPFRLIGNGNLFGRFHDLPDLCTPGRGNGLFGRGGLFRSLGK